MNYLYEKALKNKKLFCGQRILLVDDNEMNVVVMKQLLEDQGLDVEFALNGEDALKIYLHSEEFSIQIIFLDINMYGLNGYDVAREIRNSQRKDGKTIPIFAISANIFETHRQKAKEVGMNGYITKPIVYHELFEMLHQLFETKKKEGE